MFILLSYFGTYTLVVYIVVRFILLVIAKHVPSYYILWKAICLGKGNYQLP